ncbi:hypothetical protein RZS08_64590, partial [Arthrospira platensis SPKY1]|nr:hypothetical protein [Arthrospira platensis SPKY1]
DEGREVDGLLEHQRSARGRGRQWGHGFDRATGQLLDKVGRRPQGVEPAQAAVGCDLDPKPHRTLLNTLDRGAHLAAHLLTPAVAVTLAVLQRVAGGKGPFL